MRAHQQHASVAVLHVCGVNGGGQKQTLRIYQDMALCLDFLPRLNQGTSV
jgi:hypothetical protein